MCSRTRVRLPPPPFDSPSARLRRAEGSLMASHEHGECPERALDSGESKGKTLSRFSVPSFGLLHPRRRCDRRLVHWVYILRCADDSLYVGETNNLDLRLTRHNEGTGSAFAARRRPVSLVYSESHPDRIRALARERQLKRWTRAKKEALVEG